MRVIYIANARIPTEKAHGLEIFKLCEALKERGDLTMLLPRRLNKLRYNPFEYYDIKNKFSIIKLPVIDTIIFPILGKLGFWIEAISFSFFVFWYILFKTNKEDVFISHDNAPLLVVSLIRRNIFYDIHDFPVRGLFFYRILMKRSRGLITTNEWKKNELIKKFNINSDDILAYPNGVEIEDFNINLDRNDARIKLKLSEGKKIIVYVGSFIYWKGVDTLVRSVKYLKDSYKLYLVGGSKEDIANLDIKNNDKEHIVTVGNRPHEEMPLWMRAADVLVLPNTAKYDISKFYTSPMKLFEYMASGTPIVASDIPSIRNVVDERLVSFFIPDDPKDLVRAIDSIFEDHKSAIKKAEATYNEVQKYTWEERAMQIKDFYEKQSRK